MTYEHERMQMAIAMAADAGTVAEGAEAIREAAAAAGGQNKLARAIGTSIATVSRWCRGADPIPSWLPQSLEAAAAGVQPPLGTAQAVQDAMAAGWTARDLARALGGNPPYYSAIALSLTRTPAALGIAVEWLRLGGA